MKQGFFIITTVCVALSLWLSRYIPAGAFEEILSPLLFTTTVTVAFYGSFLVFKHADGLRIRRVWGWTLLIWGLIDFIYLVSYIFARSQVMDISAQHISTIELLLGNLMKLEGHAKFDTKLAAELQGVGSIVKYAISGFTEVYRYNAFYGPVNLDADPEITTPDD